MNVEVSVDEDLCAGTQSCMRWLPEVFGLGEELGLATVLDATAAPADEIVNAARACPTRAITVRRDGVPVVG